MQSPANAYEKVAAQISNPREMEAALLLQAAQRLQAAQTEGGKDSSALNKALTHNRKVWTIFLASATDANSPLERSVRENVANLGLFVIKQTMAVASNPRPEGLAPLININRELAAGLLGRA